MKPFPLALLLLALVLTACGGQTIPTPRVEDIQTAIAQTQAAEPSPFPTFAPAADTATPEPSPTPAPSVTPTPSGPISAQVAVEFLNLRAGPSTFFEVLESIPAGRDVLATGRDDSGTWVQVEISGANDEDEKTLGWFSAALLNFQGNPAFLPLVEFPFDQRVRVSVADSDGNPIPGIVVAFIHREGTLERRNDVVTGEDGLALTTLPTNLLGTLDIQIVGVDCTSPVMDAACQLRGYYELSGRAFLLIPQREAVAFQYEAASTEISGTVTDARGNPVVGIQVVAVRDDGAESVGLTGAEGAFSIPAGPGIWQVFSVRYNPRAESDAVTVEVTDETPDAVEVPAP